MPVAHDPGDDRSAMDSDLRLPFGFDMFRRSEHVKTASDSREHRIVQLAQQPGGGHKRVTDRFDFFQPVEIDDFLEMGHQDSQIGDYFFWWVPVAISRKSDDVAK